MGAAGLALATAGLAVGSLGLGRLRTLASGAHDEIETISFGEHRGALFTPASRAASEPCPSILLFDPDGNAHGIVTRYSRTASKLGWIAASCSEVKNGSDDDADAAAMTDLLAFVRTRRAIDSARVFAGGFSGGACGAYRLAIVKPEIVSGADRERAPAEERLRWNVEVRQDAHARLATDRRAAARPLSGVGGFRARGRLTHRERARRRRCGARGRPGAVVWLRGGGSGRVRRPVAGGRRRRRWRRAAREGQRGHREHCEAVHGDATIRGARAFGVNKRMAPVPSLNGALTR